MKNAMLLTNRYLQELNPVIAGEQACEPGHRFGPHIRSYTLMHYVLSGKGTLYTEDGDYPVEAGQVFLILPGQVTTYEADMLDPWHYMWVGFDGSLSQRFSQLPPVFSLEKELFTDLFPPETVQLPEYAMAGGLFRLYAHLFCAEDQENPHVQKVKNLIRTGYMEDITVERIAGQLNLDRRYLSRLFKAHTQCTVQEYLIRVRLEEADRCLRQGYSVQDSARLCGYTDVANFSRMYKKHYGLSPKNRQKQRY